ncbi:MAG: Mrp/NBP35 family ATP-binding protein [Phycisphaerales bacterium]|nr:Mrp/NBP35 family ATP-binding protein [Phycisphaerales bacterium]
MNKDDVTAALAQAKGDLGDLVRKVAACDGYVTVDLAGGESAEIERRVRTAVDAHAKARGATIKQLKVAFVGAGSQSAQSSAPRDSAASSPASGAGEQSALPGVGRVIAVGAGKGGVGKSTIAVNLAVGLARQGHAVGLLDADIYGPSLPTLLGLDAFEPTMHENRLQVFYAHGVKAMTIGKLVDPEKPLIWRGPMAHGAFKQLAEQTDWGVLDYLVVDLPPGTGDVPLTMAQLMQLTGAVIVCTPQKVAQDDAIRAVRMFQQLRIDVLGIVENMSVFVGDDGKEYDIFGRGGAEMMAQRLGLPFLGAVPLTMALRQHGDAGTPVKNFETGSGVDVAFERLVQQIEMQANLASGRAGAQGPTLVVR